MLYFYWSVSCVPLLVPICVREFFRVGPRIDEGGGWYPGFAESMEDAYGLSLLLLTDLTVID